MPQKVQFSSRPLGAADEALTFSWRQDAATCAGAVDQSPPTLAAHQEWMAERLLARVETRIVSRGGVPVGMFTIVKEESPLVLSIGYLVAPEYRGNGWSVEVRRAAIDHIRRDYPLAIALRSKIRRENKRSISTAVRMGAVQKAATTDEFLYFETSI